MSSRIGRARHRAEIQQEITPTPRDAFGAEVPFWATVGTRLGCSVRPLSGRELWQAQQVRPDVSHEVELRFWRDPQTGAPLSPKHRLLVHGLSGTRIFNLISVVNPDERAVWHRALCVEEV